MQSLCRIFLSKRKPLLFHAGFLLMVERIYLPIGKFFLTRIFTYVNYR
jgi:hypothetical protein